MLPPVLNPLPSICTLPNETLELVFDELSRTDLTSIIRTTSFFHNVASRVLYRSITELSSARAVQVVKILSQSDKYPLFVRHIELAWIEVHITGNLLRLLNRTLRRLRLLTTLAIEFSSFDNNANISWIFDGCSSLALRSFTTSVKCDNDLASFLSTQTRLVDLSLRSNDFAADFHLPTTALPNLNAFRTVLPCPHVTAAVLRDRPVETVSLSLSSGETIPSLDALLLSAAVMKRLTIMSFGAEEPKMLIPEIAKRLPGLEALHIMILMAPPSQGLLIDSGSSLSLFTNLHYLTFMAPGIPASTEDERSVATAWHRACPTLRTIILPKGIVWFRSEGNWTSWSDEEPRDEAKEPQA
ncbi:hypothetical protein BJ138DRAFT_1113786 [Hygrophoropsis aurantiaca]|uniref:Uncharacterized protein n=1 Tax=Hygrophoropsis aurantiaca TaxID=72124 RepID=A0ACB8AC06_9AGAM|nr:hypothetical protein BJ138DRAFT_1113786 [Hygrophoropsis aurantiaca]